MHNNFHLVTNRNGKISATKLVANNVTIPASTNGHIPGVSTIDVLNEEDEEYAAAVDISQIGGDIGLSPPKFTKVPAGSDLLLQIKTIHIFILENHLVEILKFSKFDGKRINSQVGHLRDKSA
jgi:hypothetical protein